MVRGQIHAPATLPNYVRLHFMNKALLQTACNLRRPGMFISLCYATGGLSLPCHDKLAVWARYMIRRLPAKTKRVTVWLSPEIWPRVLKWTKHQRALYHNLPMLTLILRRSRTGTVWLYTSTSNKRAARPKLYTKSLTKDLKRMYSRLTLMRISINL